MSIFRETRRRRFNMAKPEALEQKKVAKFLDMIGALYTCSIAGAYLSVGQLAQAKAMGYTKGTPDLMVFEKTRSPYVHALFIEMKAEKGKVSEEQRVWGERAEKNGYRYEVCYSAEEAISVIRSYMGV